jgi:hypothetical protein
MPLKNWTKKQTADLKRLWPTIPNTRSLESIIGKPFEAIKARASKLALKRTVPNSNTGRTTSTPAQDRYLKKYYLLKPVNQMAIGINRSECLVKKRMKQLGLVQPHALIEKFKLLGQFKKGAVPPNKGKNQRDFMSAAAIKRTKKTRFKKGMKHFKELFDGAISIRADKTGRPYKYIRIAKSKWVLLQVHYWEKINGPIPAGHVVAFKDGNSMNCDPANLELISRKQNMLRNSASVNLTDGYILNCLGWRNKEIQKELKNYPHLIELKRESLKLNRTIHEQQKTVLGNS